MEYLLQNIRVREIAKRNSGRNGERQYPIPNRNRQSDYRSCWVHSRVLAFLQPPGGSSSHVIADEGTAIDRHQTLLGRAPRLVAADAAFHSAHNEAAAKAKGVKRVCIPNRSTKSAERKREQKKRWFRNGQKWRTGCEGRISVTKRRHGLSRCRYKGDAGMKRWVGLGVIADNLVNISRVMAKQPVP